MDLQPFIHSVRQYEVWTKTLTAPLPLFCVYLAFMPFALHFKWIFQGIVIWGGKKISCLTSVKTVSREGTNPTVVPVNCCIVTRNLGSSLCTTATWGLDVAAMGLLPYGCLFPEKSGIRRLGEGSAKHATQPEARS